MIGPAREEKDRAADLREAEALSRRPPRRATAAGRRGWRRRRTRPPPAGRCRTRCPGSGRSRGEHLLHHLEEALRRRLCERVDEDCGRHFGVLQRQPQDRASRPWTGRPRPSCRSGRRGRCRPRRRPPPSPASGWRRDPRQLVPCPGRRGSSTLKPASAKASASGRIELGLPVKPWSRRTPCGPFQAEKGSASGRTSAVMGSS